MHTLSRRLLFARCPSIFTSQRPWTAVTRIRLASGFQAICKQSCASCPLCFVTLATPHCALQRPSQTLSIGFLSPRFAHRTPQALSLFVLDKGGTLPCVGYPNLVVLVRPLSFVISASVPRNFHVPECLVTCTLSPSLCVSLSWVQPLLAPIEARVHKGSITVLYSRGAECKGWSGRHLRHKNFIPLS